MLTWYGVKVFGYLDWIQNTQYMYYGPCHCQTKLCRWDICRNWRPRPACACAMSDQSHLCPLIPRFIVQQTHNVATTWRCSDVVTTLCVCWVNTVEYIDVQLRHWWDNMDSQADQGIRLRWHIYLFVYSSIPAFKISVVGVPFLASWKSDLVIQGRLFSGFHLTVTVAVNSLALKYSIAAMWRGNRYVKRQPV